MTNTNDIMKNLSISLKNYITMAGIASCMLIADNTFAQFGFAIGPKAGFSISSFNGNAAGVVKPKTNWVGGLFANVQFAPAFCIQPELLISQRGASYETNGVRNDLSITYFNVPVLAKLRLPLQNTFFPHVLLGPDFAYNVGASFSSTDTKTGANISADANNITKSDVGGLVGAGLDIQSNNIFLTVDARYGFGFSNLGNESYNLNFRHSGWTFALGVGYRFGE